MTPSHTTQNQPAQLLAAARIFLTRPNITTEPVWPRTCAFLARQALEQQVHDTWTAIAPAMTDCPMRSQLVCLRGYIPADLAAQVSHLWWVLSRACHHHAYELAPSAQELERWLYETDAVTRALKTAAGAERSKSPTQEHADVLPHRTSADST
jgi:hypothetical protein